MIFKLDHNRPGANIGAVRQTVIAFVVLVLLSFAGIVKAGLDEGIAAMQSEKYEAALLEFQPLADQGVAEAQFLLALMYSDGLGVREDPSKAAELLRLAAEQGLAHAQYSLGDRYFLGLGVEENAAEAMRWYEGAAKQGHPQAQFNLASMYSVGNGRPQNYVLAYMWCSVSVTGWPAGDVRARRQSKCDEILPQMSEREVAEAKELADNFTAKEEYVSHPLFREDLSNR